MTSFATADIRAAGAGCAAVTEALVNTVNCVGVMGRGIALQFKRSFPDNFKAYRAACEHSRVRPGAMFVFETGNLVNPRYIINFPTKRHWRAPSRMSDIDSGLLALAAEIRRRRIRSIAIPPLGCGCGGLRWDEVRPRIESALADIPDLRVTLLAPPPPAAPRALTPALDSSLQLAVLQS